MSIIEKAIDKLGGLTSETERPKTPPLPQGLDDETGAGGPRGAAGPDGGQHGEPLPPSPTEAMPGAAVKTSRYAPIDFNLLRQAGMLVPDSGPAEKIEEYRRIKRPILTKAFDDKGRPIGNQNLVMITSSLQGEGKTYTAINLALSIATELDQTVLLVDADLARANVSTRLGLNADVGLSEVLSGESDIADALIRTNVEKLSVLPSGKRGANVTELFSSVNTRNLTLELSGRYPDRIVLFDSPPLLAASETVVIANLVGQIIVVVEAEKTSEQSLLEALQLLDAKANVGLILNKTNVSTEGGYYYGYA